MNRRKKTINFRFNTDDLGTQRTVTYGYDQVGFRTQTAYPDGSTTITRTNTFDGRINTLSRGQTQLAAFQYLGSRTARRAYTTLPAVNTDYAWDHLGRMTDITSGSLADFHYDYAADENNIWKIRFDHRSGTPYNEYGYDDIDRVTGVTYLDSDTENFVMDDLGNRFGNQTLRDDGTVNFAVNTGTNRYTSVAGHTLAYDDAGNLTTDKDGYHFVYDYENRPERIYKLNGQTQITVATFDYDTQGRRIRKVDKIADTTTLYYYSDNWQVLAEYNGTGTLQAYYVYGNYIDEVLLMHRNSADKYYLHDHLFSPVALTDSNGTVQERYEYDVYGKATVWNAALTTTYSISQYGNTYTFTGRELDVLDNGNLKKMHYRHREYNPFMGRFYQADPLGIQPSGFMEYNPFSATAQYNDSLSLYLAFRALPMLNTDPYGLWGSDVHNDATRRWAKRVGYPGKAASAVGAADDAVDGGTVGGTGPYPWGDPSYHFNRNRFGGMDTRMVHYIKHFARAKLACHPAMDDPDKAVEELGKALHPYQDIEAHQDFGLRDNTILLIHNEMSPQQDLLASHGATWHYPDDPDLDSDGPIQYGSVVKQRTPMPVVISFDYYNYVTGRNRYNRTRMKTVETLKGYYWFVQSIGGCKCKKYFIGD